MGTTEPSKFFPNSIMGPLWGPICDFPIFIFSSKTGLIMIFFEIPFVAKRRNVELKELFQWCKMTVFIRARFHIWAPDGPPTNLGPMLIYRV
jgi:hypothetical protein